MQIPPSSIVFFIICGIPLFVMYLYLLRKIKGLFWRSLGVSLLFLFLIIAVFIVIFVSKDMQPIGY